MVAETEEERQEIDPVFKQIVEEAFAAYKVTCQTQYEVGRLPRTIDALVTINDPAERDKIRAETAFFYFLQDNQLEFKGRNDRLTKKGYHAIRGRMEFLLHGKQVSPFDMTVTIISAGKPHKVLTYANELKRPFVAMAQKGYYKSDEYPPIYLIVINELPVAPEHYPLLLFASSEEKFREFLAQVITSGEYTYVRYAYEVRPLATKEVLTMAGVTSRLSRKELEFMAGDIGPELVPFLHPGDVVKGMNAEKRQELLSLFDPADLFKGMMAQKQEKLFAHLLATMSMEEILQEISPKDRKKLFELVLKTVAADLTEDADPDRNDNG